MNILRPHSTNQMATWNNSSWYSEAILIQWNDTFYKPFGLNDKDMRHMREYQGHLNRSAVSCPVVLWTTWCASDLTIGVQIPLLAYIFSSVIWLLYSFFCKFVYYSKYLSLLLSIFIIMISKKKYFLADLNIVWSKKPLKMLVGIYKMQMY